MGKVANSHQMMTVTVEHFRQVSHCVRESLGLTYNEFLALIALYETRATLGASDLADYLLLQRKTTWNILLTLEDLGLVSKTVEENDHRTMRCALTVKGEGVAVRGAEIVARFLRERFLRNLQDEEFSNLCEIPPWRAATSFADTMSMRCPFSQTESSTSALLTCFYGA